MEQLHSLAGFVGAALVDSDSGMALGMTGGTELNLELAAAGNTEVVRAKRRIAEQLGLNDTIEDILITLSKQYHLLRPLESNGALFLYVVLDRAKANLAMARHELKAFEKTLDFG
nr:roadblock/LC7 domain-containing protein [Xanthomonas campestris]